MSHRLGPQFLLKYQFKTENSWQKRPTKYPSVVLSTRDWHLLSGFWGVKAGKHCSLILLWRQQSLPRWFLLFFVHHYLIWRGWGWWKQYSLCALMHPFFSWSEMSKTTTACAEVCPRPFTPTPSNIQDWGEESVYNSQHETSYPDRISSVSCTDLSTFPQK